MITKLIKHILEPLRGSVERGSLSTPGSSATLRDPGLRNLGFSEAGIRDAKRTHLGYVPTDNATENHATANKRTHLGYVPTGFDLLSFSRVNILSLLLFLTGITTGCVNDEITPPEPEAPAGAVLHLTTGSSFSRANDGHYDDDPYAEGEEAIKRVSLFFFESEETEDAAFYVCETTTNDVTTADLTVKLPMEYIDKFKDSENNPYVYALVNLPETVEVDESSKKIGRESATLDATLDNLKKIWVDDPGFTTSDKTPDTFVMRGGSEDIKVMGEDKFAYVTGTIRLERLASKIRLWADIPRYIYLDENGKTIQPEEGETEDDLKDRAAEVWQSDPLSDQNSNVKLYIYNVATKGRIDGYVGSKEERDETENSMLGYDNIDRSKEKENFVRLLSLNADIPAQDVDNKYPYSHPTAYYSYPNIWDKTSPLEKNESYVILSLPWTRIQGKEETGELTEVCYYQIPINALQSTNGGSEEDFYRLEPNKYYRIKVKIGMLGAKDLGEAQEVKASYEVVDWVTNNVDVSIKDRRFLMVNQKDLTMNNVDEIEFPFSSSHDVIVKACYVTYFRYKDEWGTQDAAGHAKNEFDYWQKAADNDGNVSSTKNETGGSTGEGILEGVTFDGTNDNVLYYKSKYFYDEVNKDYETYYVGREHPKTYDYRKYNNSYTKTKIEYNEANNNYDNGKYKTLWDDYNSKYKNINAVYTCTVENGKRKVIFKHPMIQWKEVRDNNGKIQFYYPEEKKEYERTGEDDDASTIPRGLDIVWEEFSRCEIVIKLRHKDREELAEDPYEETVYITQYPGIYIDVSHNYGSAGGSGNEYTFVNGSRVKFEDSGIWYFVDRLDNFKVSENSASNNNPNMYIITTTQLNEEEGKIYDIGDPRVLYRNNLLRSDENSQESEDKSPLVDAKVENPWLPTYNNRWKGINQYNDIKYNDAVFEVTSSSNNSRILYKRTDGRLYGSLEYYYPTDETPATEVGSKETFIAPSFRIASSFGRIGDNGRVEMRRRCAAYQEAGRPAGRWRLPTKAEVKFIAKLSAEGKIPILFGFIGDQKKFGYYWTATGGIRVSGTGIVEDNDVGEYNGTFAARCVYDEWYWNEVDKKLGYELSPKETKFIWGDVPKDNSQVDPVVD